MFYRKSLLVSIICACTLMVNAQVNTSFQKADSLSYALYASGNWQELIAIGDKYAHEGLDFPYLRLRTGYASLMLGNYSRAAVQYQKVLESDSYNQTARYYLYYCNKYLNRNLSAFANAGMLAAETLKKENLSASGISDFGVETGFKYPGIISRGNAVYGRAGLGYRLGWKLQLDQSLAYFNQQLATASASPGPGLPAVNAYDTDNQVEYFGKLSYALQGAWSVLGAYHFLSAGFAGSSYQSHIGLAGVKYSSGYVTLQADANAGEIMDQHIGQYNASIAILPLGNLNLYSFTRGSYLQPGRAGHRVISELLGVKTGKNLWLEASGAFGGLDNFLDADALYVYNAVDPSKSRFGGSILFSLGAKTLLQINYTLENKQEINQQTTYNQQSVTGGISWKF